MTSQQSPLRTKRLAQCLAALGLCIAMAGDVSGADLGLITAGEHGTYYHFGQDLRRLLKPQGINVIVHRSNGAVENVRALIDRPGVQLGIVQSDMLTAITEQQRNLAMRAAAEGMRLVFPLYDEQVHIVARAGIKDIGGLAGQLVAIGGEGSGTYLTALALFQLAAVVPGAMIAMDGAEALAHLRAGRIDAMVSVAGHPVRLLHDGVTLQDDLALVPVTAPAILDAYAATEIPAGMYPWQPNAVPTVAVTALLVVYDAGRRHCATIGRLAHHVVEGLGWLVENGHPYWKRVDLQRPIKGWEQYDCVRQYAEGHGPSMSPVRRPALHGATRVH
jgi:TRAP transporter TAXI family solute receptor